MPNGVYPKLHLTILETTYSSSRKYPQQYLNGQGCREYTHPVFMSSPGLLSQASGGSPAQPGASPAPAPPAAPAKRSRVLLSCAPCRASKLKCDRAQPCSNCIKKDRTDGCQYAPKKVKVRPAKSMSARLKRLEGMVRGMFEAEAERDAEMARLKGSGVVNGDGEGKMADTGHVVSKDGQTNWIGATHFMAMLDDIEDLKSYFDDPQQEADVGSPEGASPDPMAEFILEKGPPKSKQELLSLLPPRQTLDRLVMGYFNANSLSQHTVHRPTFIRQYKAFLASPQSASVEWLALLFMVMALGVYFSTWSSPHDSSPSPSPSTPAIATSHLPLFRHYRSAAGWALTTCKLTTYPGPRALQPFLLYVEAEFLINRSSQTHAWLLCALCIRIMIKMGLHRDPAGLAAISPFDGEMRRRMWNYATQLDLVTSFHMGLPSMVSGSGGLESDTKAPLNIVDEDFGPEGDLPPPRPLGEEYTYMSYPICKGIVCRVFGLVAAQVHALARPSRSEVLRLDGLLESAWREIPSFMKVRPLTECQGEPAMRVIQRFGLASLFQKSKAVLHRRYLVGRESGGGYERRECLRAALALLEYHRMIWEAARPGGVLCGNGWFVTGVAMHDFLLAAMIVYLVVQGGGEDGGATPEQNGSVRSGVYGAEHPYITPTMGSVEGGEIAMGNDGGGNATGQAREPNEQNNANSGQHIPDRDGLVAVLRQSHEIWVGVARSNGDCKKAAMVLEQMLHKIQRRQEEVDALDVSMSDRTPTPVTLRMNGPSTNAIASSSNEPRFELSTMHSAMPSLDPRLAPGDMLAAGQDVPLVHGFDQWFPDTGDLLDWSTVDDGLRISTRNSVEPEDQGGSRGWAPPSAAAFEFMSTGFWDQDQAPR